MEGEDSTANGNHRDEVDKGALEEATDDVRLGAVALQQVRSLEIANKPPVQFYKIIPTGWAQIADSSMGAVRSSEDAMGKPNRICGKRRQLTSISRTHPPRDLFFRNNGQKEYVRSI